MKLFLHRFFFLLALVVCLLNTDELSAQLRVQTGKSYININKPTGGIIENGNELEIRAVIAVTGGTAYFVRFNDTIPAGTTYKPNSIRFSTNEGMVYEQFKKLKNISDLLSLIKNFGIQYYQPCAATQPISYTKWLWNNQSFGGTLSVWLSYDLEVEEIENINSILASKNINFKF